MISVKNYRIMQLLYDIAYSDQEEVIVVTRYDVEGLLSRIEDVLEWLDVPHVVDYVDCHFEFAGKSAHIKNHGDKLETKLLGSTFGMFVVDQLWKSE